MNSVTDPMLADYYAEAETWSDDREASQLNFRRLAWIAIGVLALIAVVEAIALAVMLPLKTVEPYTLLVDKQTGYVEALKPLERQKLSPDEALVKSFLAQYVIAREQFDIDSLNATYRKVALWSADEARSRYLAEMQASNPASPLARLPRQALVEVQVRSISSLSADTALVRFATVETDPGGQKQDPQPYAAVLKFRFSGDSMSAADRMLNPLGFQVVRYRRDAEMLPAEPQVASVVPGQQVPMGVPMTAPRPQVLQRGALMPVPAQGMAPGAAPAARMASPSAGAPTPARAAPSRGAQSQGPDARPRGEPDKSRPQSSPGREAADAAPQPMPHRTGQAPRSAGQYPLRFELPPHRPSRAVASN